MANKRKTKGTAGDDDLVIGGRLRIARSKLNWSQERLAEAVGLTFQQIQKYERGLNRISAVRLKEFCSMLEVDPMWMLYGDDDVPEYEALMSKDMLKMVKKYDMLDDAMQMVVFKNVCELTKLNEKTVDKTAN